MKVYVLQLEISEKISTCNSALSDEEDNTLRLSNMGGLAILPMLRTL